ncbi:spastin-like isoform X1 [Hydractinia symbiolongicarpus]|uniref:spastin-like isoform X1 n=2 Tax=Hydractinia symbiolongicarpus TaxID=13093 RepID=UPI002551AFDB|nr:spastin-like isoform X1 [Hydractinia symbiolongicarpus]XP_057315668.1 spastin-like isoform X1 [Hydractinia symbiolongicarpus]
MENEKKKDSKPEEVLKVHKHHKQGYTYMSSALELDESQVGVENLRKAAELYEKGIHEFREGISIKLDGVGSDYDKARKLQEKMESNLKDAESRIVEITILLEDLRNDQKTASLSSKGHSGKPAGKFFKTLLNGSSGPSTLKGSSSMANKTNGVLPKSTAPKKPPFRPAGVSAPSKNQVKCKGPKEPSTEQHKIISNLKNVDSKHANLILNEVIEKGRGVSFDDIGGMEKAKQTLHEIVILPALRPELFTGLRAPARGLLLFGPPGNGKTLLAKAVATEANAVFFNISAASLTSKWVGEGEKMVRAMFAVARELQPAIIFIDEIDSLLSERKENENEATRRLKTEFLVGFDGVISESQERILVMGATNRPWELDDAALRRLVKRVHVPLPSHEARIDILKKILSKHPNVSMSVNDLNTVSRKTEGYSGSDLAALSREAALVPIRKLTPDQIKSVPADKVRGMIAEDFIEAMKTIRPSVSGGYLKKFDEWNEKYGSVS